MKDITELVQLVEVPELPPHDPVSQMAGMIQDLHDADDGDGNGDTTHPRPYPGDYDGDAEPTSAELYACGFPEKNTMEEINAAIFEKAESYGIPMMPLKAQNEKGATPDPRSFSITRDVHGRLSYNAGIAVQYTMYSNLVANARPAPPSQTVKGAPQLYPNDPFQEEMLSGGSKGKAVPPPPGVVLPKGKRFIRDQPRTLPMAGNDMQAIGCILVFFVPWLVFLTIAAWLSNLFPVLVLLAAFVWIYSRQGPTGQLVVMSVFMALQLLAVLGLETALDALCSPIIGWPYNACLEACDCSCSIASLLAGVGLITHEAGQKHHAGEYSIGVAPALPDQYWANCAAASDAATCLYASDDGRIAQCNWDERASTCTFACDRIYDAEYCKETGRLTHGWLTVRPSNLNTGTLTQIHQHLGPWGQ